MNEEEKSNLYIYTYSDLDDDFVFAETKYTLGDLHKLQQELQKYKENYECILKQRDDITKNATQQIESLIDEKNKYKSLYENEKDHTDTLKRIIKKIEEYIRNINDWEICSKYDAIYKDEVLDILDLLKEVK